MKMLDRAGTFMVRPLSWGLQKKQTGSVQMVIEYMILAQFDDGQWVDWSGFEDHSITGYHNIVKKDGSVNTMQVELLAESIGWDGNMEAVKTGPPAAVCQIDCRYEEYNGKESLKVAWIAHGDRIPGQNVAPPEVVDDLSKVYGTLMRASAGSAKREPMALPAKKAGTDDSGDDLPF